MRAFGTPLCAYFEIMNTVSDIRQNAKTKLQGRSGCSCFRVRLNGVPDRLARIDERFDVLKDCVRARAGGVQRSGCSK